MNGYIAFVKKELMENTRNYRLFIMLALFFIFGMLGPMTAKFTPQLIASLTPNMQITIAEPTALDSWIQFYKNVPSLGFSLMIIIFSGCLSSEYSKGTLTIMLTKGLSRPAVILSKFSVAAAIMTISYWMSFGITYGYTAYFWQGQVLPHMIFSAFALWMVGLLYLSILIFGCVLFRQAFPSIIFLLGVTVIMTLIGIPKQLASYNPLILTLKNVDLISGTVSVSEFIMPIVIAIIFTVGFLFSATLLFNKKQL